MNIFASISNVTPQNDVLVFDPEILNPTYEVEEPDEFVWLNEGFYGQDTSEIQALHAKIPLLADLDTLGAVYPGGYALALYAAPARETPQGLQLDRSFFGDIDVIHEDPKRTPELISFVKDNYNVVKEYITPRATSLWVDTGQYGEIMLQFVTSWQSSMETILTRFDFDNCKICYYPRDEAFLAHEDLEWLLNHNRLRLSQDWADYTPPNALALSIPRALKYAKRWGWRLDAFCINRLTRFWLSMSSEKRWLPPAQTDSGLGVIAQGSVESDATKLGTYLHQLYELHHMTPPDEIIVGASAEENTQHTSAP